MNTIGMEFHEVGFYTTILGGLFQAAQKSRDDEGRPIGV